MPSETTNVHGMSPSSYLLEEVQFPGEKPVRFWKNDTMVDRFGAKMDMMPCKAHSMAVTSSVAENPIMFDTQATKCLEIPNGYLVPDQKINICLQRQAIGAERAARSLNLQNHMEIGSGARYNLNAQPSLFLKEGEKHNYENGLFSSSLSDLFAKKLNVTSDNVYHGHSVDMVSSHCEEEEPLESLKEIEAQTIGNLLPDDDDLFSGIVDGIKPTGQSWRGDDMEDLDLFSSIGGMELGDDESSNGLRNSNYSGGIFNGGLGVSNISVVGEQPSRTLFVRNINSNVEDSELKALFGQYGEIHTLYTACKHRGFVMISYYDIRAARNAMKALQCKILRHRKLDIHYSIPKDNPSDKDVDQGTVVVSNLESSVSNDDLRQILGVYGEIKEIRETPHRSNRKIVEFFDIRAAEAALCALNQNDFVGKRIKLEPSQPGGVRHSFGPQVSSEMEQEAANIYRQQSIPDNSSATGFPGLLRRGPITSACLDSENVAYAGTKARTDPLFGNMFGYGISSSVPSSLQSLLRGESVGAQPGFSKSGNSFNQTKYNLPGMLPEYHDSLANGAACMSPGNIPSSFESLSAERMDKPQFGRSSMAGHSLETGRGFGLSRNDTSSLPGHPYMWGNSNQQQASNLMWPNSPSLADRVCSPQSPSRHGHIRPPSRLMNSMLSINDHHHVGSAPAVNALWGRQNSYPLGSPETTGFHQGSLGSMRLSSSPLHHMEFATRNVFSHGGGNCLDMPISSASVGFHSQQQRSMLYPGRGQTNPMMNTLEPPNDRPRNRRNDNGSQADKKQFELDLERIMKGEDNRTTLMIKNIPNKYTSKMLMAAIDERHRGTYDFIYLPIDFKNKCNVGYAFINMTEPRHIVPFYESFNGKKWEKFNSEKIASLAYARIQGKSALIAHFQNSSLMNEDKRCRPILFHSEGPNAGDQVPFPMGVNIRPKLGKPRTASSEDNRQGSPPIKDYASDLDSGSGKESL